MYVTIILKNNSLKRGRGKENKTKERHNITNRD
jgi:hypothetical protein